MATRGTVKFIEDDEIIASIYIHWDAYISELGYKLANWLNTKKMLNGISGQTMESGFANGIGCLAAQFIKEFKREIGGLYMYPNNAEEEYNYKISYINNKFIITVNNIFKGTVDELLNFKEN